MCFTKIILHKMKIERNIFSAAVGTLNGSIGVILGKSKVKPVLDDIRCFARQKSFTLFRLVEQFNRVSPNRAFSIAAALRAILSITTMARKKSVLVANNGKVQSLQSSELALTTRSGVNGSNPLHVVPLYTG